MQHLPSKSTGQRACARLVAGLVASRAQRETAALRAKREIAHDENLAPVKRTPEMAIALKPLARAAPGSLARRIANPRPSPKQSPKQSPIRRPIG
jgi:hypothetical protein